ncbi:MAG TPA: cytochrome b5 domain-containing protein [Lachnospiraceae bacterium]|nr:cytochrome b5 domain-containing protein [Lachnospiraceae bacterium]
MLEELGELFGWLLVIAFAGTIMNYCIKFVNKRFGKKISAYPFGKKIMKVLMTIFVRNHKYFGFATLIFLLAHFIIQYGMFGFNVTGTIAAVIMIIQVLLGVYANVRKKPRKGAWFIAHRTITVLIILGIAIHLIIPNALNAIVGKDSKISSSVDVSKLETFTLEELTKYNGENGCKAYVAYKGLVYDVTNVSKWQNGKHYGQKAGTDITEAISESPHGDSVFEGLDVVGKIN